MRSCVSTWRQPENTQLGGFGWIALSNQHRSADQFGEQTYIKRGKGSGGMKGISTSTEQVAVWVNSFSVRPPWHRHRTYVQWRWEEQKPHGGVDGEEKNKHKEEGEGRRRLDEADRRKITVELEKYIHPLNDQQPGVYNICNGQVATNTVNVQNAGSSPLH